MLVHALKAVIQLSSHKGVVATLWLCSFNTTLSNQHVCKSSVSYLTAAALNCRLEITLSACQSVLRLPKLKKAGARGDKISWSRAASCAKRGKSELLSLQSFLRSQTTVALISHPNCKFKNGGVRLTCILDACTLSARASEDLQGSNAPLQHLRPPNQKGRFAFFQCLVSHKDLENLQPGLMISIKDQWVFHNVWPKLELCIENREVFSL